MSSRLRVEQRRTAALALGGGALVLVTTLWTPHLLPERRALDPTMPVRTSGPQSASRPAIHARMFDVDLVRPLPGRTQATERGNAGGPGTATIGTLTLISITEIGGERVAMLYDASEDRLYMVRNGERVRGALVQEIAERSFRATSDAREQRWTLDGGAH